MLAGKLADIGRYAALIPHFDAIKDYLDVDRLASMAVGRYPIAGDDAYLMVQSYATKLERDAFWESHTKYIDLQIILRGEEYIGYAPVSSLAVERPYDEVKDVIKYRNDPMTSRMRVEAGMYCVFFAEDGHKPVCAVGESRDVLKAVVKIRSNG